MQCTCESPVEPDLLLSQPYQRKFNREESDRALSHCAIMEQRC